MWYFYKRVILVLIIYNFTLLNFLFKEYHIYTHNPYNWHFNLFPMLLLPSILVCYWALIPWLFGLLLLIMKLTHGPVPHWICLIDRSGFSFLVFSLFLFQYIYTNSVFHALLFLPPSFLTCMYISDTSFEKGLEKKRGWRRMTSSLDLVTQTFRASLLVFITF